jgi:hypothetical protein
MLQKLIFPLLLHFCPALMLPLHHLPLLNPLTLMPLTRAMCGWMNLWYSTYSQRHCLLKLQLLK